MIPFHIDHGHLPRASSLTDFLGQWEGSPYVIAPLAVVVCVYLFGMWRLQRRTKYTVPSRNKKVFFAVGISSLVLALMSPIHVYAEELFFFHMIQHLLIMMVAAPFILLSEPLAVYLWALPDSPRHTVGKALSRTGVLRWLLRGATTPLVAWLVYVVVIWAWHAPVPYSEASANEGIHSLEHLTMFLGGLLFWWPVIGPAPVRSQLPYPMRFLYLFLALFQNIVLAAILTFADAPLYEYYEGAPQHWGIGPDVDQQMGGIIMWIPGAMMYFVAAAILFFRWLSQEEREAARWASGQERRRLYLIAKIEEDPN